MFHQKWIASDRKFLPHGILHSFNFGLTYEQTLANLLTAQQKNPVLYPRVHAQDVEFWYNSFKNGNYDLNQKPTQNPRSNLLSLPVFDQVIHSVNAADQQALRKTCKSLKGFIEKENRLYDTVELRMTKDSVMLQTKSGINNPTSRTVFNKTEDGTDIVKERNKRSKSEGDFMELAMTDFRKTIMMLHTKIKYLIVNYNVFKAGRADRKRFVKEATDVLASLKEPIHVEDIDLSIKDPAELELFLKTIKPGALTKLKVHVDEGIRSGGSREVFRTKKVPSLASHWDHLRSLNISSVPIDRKLQDFVHIPTVFVTLAKITPKRIKAYKTKIVHQSDIQYHCFFKSTMHGNPRLPVDAWKEAMQPFEPIIADFDGNNEEVAGFVSFLDSSTDVLKFKINGGIHFSRRAKNSNLSELY